VARPSGYCWNHDPELAEARKEGNSRGGRNRSNAKRASRELIAVEARDARANLVPGLTRAFEKVEAGDLAPNVANSMATIAKALVEVTNATQVDAEIEELRQAIEDLRRQHGSPVRRFGS
jgi:hypothetical protein